MVLNHYLRLISAHKMAVTTIRHINHNALTIFIITLHNNLTRKIIIMIKQQINLIPIPHAIIKPYKISKTIT